MLVDKVETRQFIMFTKNTRVYTILQLLCNIVLGNNVVSCPLLGYKTCLIKISSQQWSGCQGLRRVFSV